MRSKMPEEASVTDPIYGSCVPDVADCPGEDSNNEKCMIDGDREGNKANSNSNMPLQWSQPLQTRIEILHEQHTLGNDENFADEPSIEFKGFHSDHSDSLLVSATQDLLDAEERRLEEDTFRSIPHVLPLQISDWPVLWALIMNNGERRLTKGEYQSVRMFVASFGSLALTPWKEKKISNRKLALVNFH